MFDSHQEVYSIYMVTTQVPRDADPRDRLIWSLRRAEMAVQTLKDRELRTVNMAASHYTLLISIREEPGLSGAALARRLNLTPQAIASLVARLETRGLLERRTHPRHQQIHELHLTDAGAAAVEQADQIMEGIERDVVDIVGASEKDALRSVLDHLTDTIRTL